jgi:hypothetical protein
LQGATAASYQVGYQLALICGGAGALVAASGHGWTWSYLVMAGCMLVAPITCLLVPEPVALIDRRVNVDPALIQATIARMRAASLVVAIGFTLVAGAALHFALPAQESSTVIDTSFGAILFFEVLLLMVLRIAMLRRCWSG